MDTQERRKSDRFPIECHEVIVRFQESQASARVLNVSPEGAGLLLDASPEFEVSQTIETDFVGNRATAVVRRIDERNDGSYYVGVEYVA